MPPKPPTRPPGKPPARSPSRRPAPAKAPRPPEAAAPTDAPERIAKVLARAGLASRRDAEEMVRAGRVTVNGRKLDTPAVTVTASDRITVDGKPLPAPDRARLWMYHKPAGLVTTARDEQGRATVFDNLPEGMPRVMPVGRLDLTSEGLLLLTNDGEVKRKLELPATGWLRRYRVRVHGTPTEAQLAPLKAGIVIEGERFQPMIVGLDRQQGANAWLTVGLREGKNREIRRAMEAVGLTVNRLIRVSYGPFTLGDLPSGEVREVPARVLADQLGQPVPADATTEKTAEKTAPPRRSWGMKSHGGRAAQPATAAGTTGGAPAASGKPRSWGSKTHQPPATGPKRPPRPGTSPGASPRVSPGQSPRPHSGPRPGPGKG